MIEFFTSPTFRTVLAALNEGFFLTERAPARSVFRRGLPRSLP